MICSQSYGFSHSHGQMWELDHKEGRALKNWCFRTVVLEKTLQGPLGRKEIKPVNPKGNQFSSVVQLCLTLCDPMECNMTSFSVYHQFPELTQTHVYQVSDAIQPSHPLIPFSSCLQSFPASGSFPMSQFFSSSGQSIGTSVLASVLSMNIQEWFPFGLTGLISLQSKGLSRVFSNITVQKYQFFSAQLSLWSNSHIHTWLLEKP